MRNGFLIFFDLKSHISLFRLLRFGLSPSIKLYFPIDLNFYLIFFDFLMFLSSTCYNLCLFVGFCMSDSNSNVVSIRQISHIKSLFISMLLQIWNLRYS